MTGSELHSVVMPMHYEQQAAETDPFISRLLSDYRLADTVAEFGVFVRR